LKTKRANNYRDFGGEDIEEAKEAKEELTTINMLP
jgi:hypothetical protein